MASWFDSAILSAQLQAFIFPDIAKERAKELEWLLERADKLLTLIIIL